MPNKRGDFPSLIEPQDYSTLFLYCVCPKFGALGILLNILHMGFKDVDLRTLRIPFAGRKS